jgi:8-oxo-dGTP pyrophosphatase MutT (NUDIX family)
MRRLAQRLREALAEVPREPLFPGDDPRLAPGEGVPAAVLIAVTDRPEPGVILTVRRDTMRTHAGQVAFPGGRIDEGEDAVAAALREAWEELELEPAAVVPVATLDDYRTITNYCVTPVLAAVPPDLALSPHDREVADWFEAPLGYLLDPRNQMLRSVLFEGAERHYYEIPWQERRIWGATAAMLVNLSRRLSWP